jgi:hypothetical protein
LRQRGLLNRRCCQQARSPGRARHRCRSRCLRLRHKGGWWFATGGHAAANLVAAALIRQRARCSGRTGQFEAPYYMAIHTVVTLTVALRGQTGALHRHTISVLAVPNYIAWLVRFSKIFLARRTAPPSCQRTAPGEGGGGSISGGTAAEASIAPAPAPESASSL